MGDEGGTAMAQLNGVELPILALSASVARAHQRLEGGRTRVAYLPCDGCRAATLHLFASLQRYRGNVTPWYACQGCGARRAWGLEG